MTTIKDITYSKNRVTVTYSSGNVVTHIETDHATAVRESGRCSNCGNDEKETTPLFQYLDGNDEQPAVVDWVCC